MCSKQWLNINISLTVRHIVTGKKNERKEGRKYEKRIKAALSQYAMEMYEHAAVTEDL